MAFFSCLLLFKINAIEKKNQPDFLHSSQIETTEWDQISNGEFSKVFLVFETTFE